MVNILGTRDFSEIGPVIRDKYVIYEFAILFMTINIGLLYFQMWLFSKWRQIDQLQRLPRMQ